MPRHDERYIDSIRTLDEALMLDFRDSGKSSETVAAAINVQRRYLNEALNPEHDELQFQARTMLPFWRETVLPGRAPIGLQWLAQQLGFVLVPTVMAASGHDVVTETLDVSIQAGKLAERVQEGARQGFRCPVVRSDIKEESRRMQREAAEVERAVESLEFEGKKRA